jgi:hypothetical protein
MPGYARGKGAGDREDECKMKGSDAASTKMG